MPEDSSEDSAENRQVERAQRARQPYVTSDKVRSASTPVTVRQRLDVDAVLGRSLRKVVGEE
jgi:hypothetical protein